MTGGAGFIDSISIENLFENVKALSLILIFEAFIYTLNTKNYEKYILILV